MKKKLLITLLPVLGTAIIVGSGFSAWAFNKGVTTSAAFTGTMNVEYAVADLKIDEEKTTMDDKSFNVYLDQGGLGNKDVSQGITDNLADGLTVAISTEDTRGLGTAIGEYHIDITWTMEITTHTSYIAFQDDLATKNNAATTSSTKITKTYTNIVNSESLDFKYTADTADGSNKGTWVFTVYTNIANADEAINEESHGDVTTTGKYDTFKYVDKPESYSDWSNMNSAITSGGDLKISFSFEATLHQNETTISAASYDAHATE